MIEGRRVLVIGLNAMVNRSVVQPLRDLGVDAEGYTQPERAGRTFNARDFELIVFARAALGPVSEKLKRGFTTQNPHIAFVDAIGPVAVNQTLAALAHDPRTQRFISGLRVVNESANAGIQAIVRAACRVSLTIYRKAGAGLSFETLDSFEVQAGPLERGIEAQRLEDAYSLLLTANEQCHNAEYHHHPFLSVG